MRRLPRRSECPSDEAVEAAENFFFEGQDFNRLQALRKHTKQQQQLSLFLLQEVYQALCLPTVLLQKRGEEAAAAAGAACMDPRAAETQSTYAAVVHPYYAVALQTTLKPNP